mmetsp:Transcript_104179/g.199997  ORF Transcript_104179/g.199997 Transcript_104179/m.199997 type:complete len:253 (+) Transcript_104179:564-1322(+)
MVHRAWKASRHCWVGHVATRIPCTEPLRANSTAGSDAFCVMVVISPGRSSQVAAIVCKALRFTMPSLCAASSSVSISSSHCTGTDILNRLPGTVFKGHCMMSWRWTAVPAIGTSKPTWKFSLCSSSTCSASHMMKLASSVCLLSSCVTPGNAGIATPEAPPHLDVSTLAAFSRIRNCCTSSFAPLSSFFSSCTRSHSCSYSNCRSSSSRQASSSAVHMLYVVENSALTTGNGPKLFYKVHEHNLAQDISRLK